MSGLKTILKKYRRFLIIAAFTAAGIVGLVNIYYVTSVTPVSNDECIWYHGSEKDNLSIYFTNIKEGGVTDKAGIKEGDIFLKLNGVNLWSTFQAQGILNDMETGEYAVYTIKRGDEVFDTKVYIKKLVNLPELVYALLGFMFLIIGFIVIMAKPEGAVHKLFFLNGAGFVIVMFYIVLFYERIHLPTDELLRNMYVVWYSLAVFAPAIMIHFFTVFPRRYKLLDNIYVKSAIYLIPVLLIINKSIQGFNYAGSVIPLFPNLELELFFFIVAACVFSFFLIAMSYFLLKEKKKKRPVAIIIISYLLGALAILFITQLLPRMGVIAYNTPEAYLPILLVLLFPIAFGYAIFRYQLIDVSYVVRKTLTYGTATISVAVIYLLSVYGLGQSFGEVIGTEYQNIIAVVFFIIFALLFQKARDRYQDLITRRFYPEQYVLQQILHNFSRELVNMIGLANILDAIRNTFVKDLKLNEFALFLKADEDTMAIIRSYGIKSKNYVLKSDLRSIEKQINLLHSSESNIVLDKGRLVKALPADNLFMEAENIYTIVPLLIKQRLVGMVALGLKANGTQFVGREMELLDSVGNHAAVSIENARLYAAEAEKLQMERDLELARQIQQSLLPAELPEDEKLDIFGQMIPASQVGGDYFDVIIRNENHVFVVVGDVSGKGLSAALYMTKLQTMLQLYCTLYDSPKEILTRLNSKLSAELGRKWFISLTLAMIDKSNMKASICRAGHMPTLICNNAEFHEIRNNGIALGLDTGTIFDSSLQEDVINLEPGQVIAFYSDGVNETRNESEEEYGIERFNDLVFGNRKKSASDIFNTLWKDLHNFRSNAPLHDDVTAVIIKIK